MLQEFQVLYRQNQVGSPILSVLVRAESEEEARQMVAECGALPQSISPGLPVIDWTKPAFTRDEAAVFLSCGATHFYRLQMEGKIPRPASKHQALFRRRDLEAFRASIMEGEAA